MIVKNEELIIKRAQHKKTLLILLAVIFVILFKSYVMNRVIISGIFMESTYKHGDIVFAEKITKYYKVSRYDVVVINIKGMVIIKRIIGLPNETVLIKNGRIYIDGEALIGDDVYIDYAGAAAEPYYLSGDEYFVLGDNINESYDSRDVGAVTKKQITGKPIFRVFPLDRIGLT